MWLGVAAFAVALVCCSVLTPVVRLVAVRCGLLDHALSSRKIHGQPIPRLGGVAIVQSFVLAILGVAFWDSSAGALLIADDRSVVLLSGAFVIAALGLYDDLLGAGAKLKFGVQFAAAALMYVGGLRIDDLALPFLGVIDLGVLSFPLTLLWIAGVTNAFNLIDGLDGLAGGVAFVALLAVLAIALGRGDVLTLYFGGALAGAVLGFLFFNFNPASIFMGDTGSMFLGFVLATTSLQTSHKTDTAVALLVPIVALGLPIADTLLAMARRALRGVPLFSPDSGHIHHRLLARGLSQRETVLVLYGFACCLAAAALVLTHAPDHEALLALALVLGAAGGVLRWLGFLNPARFQELLEARRRNVAMKVEMDEIVRRMQRAAEPSALWDEVLAAAPVVGADHVALVTNSSNWGTTLLKEDAVDLLRARFPVRGERAIQGDALELAWTDGRQRLDRDTEIAIEQLCGQLANELERIRRDRALVPATDAAGARRARFRRTAS